jgi:7-cyano-7-deazaguanine synthase
MSNFNLKPSFLSHAGPIVFNELINKLIFVALTFVANWSSLIQETRMPQTRHDNTIGLLISGGLDSSILLSHLLYQGETVQPFYIRTDVVWQRAEQNALKKYLVKEACEQLLPLVEFEMPMTDLYAKHWSTTGDATPDASTPDEAVFLPGRNALLMIKPAIWAQMHGLKRLALGPLASNPFDDAKPEFFTAYETMLKFCGQSDLQILRPFAQLHKHDVMKLGRNAPLEWTWSCIAPAQVSANEFHHCGKCNKCAERKLAFKNAEIRDETKYAS